jgi:hypothetical protein
MTIYFFVTPIDFFILGAAHDKTGTQTLEPSPKEPPAFQA